MTLPEGQKPTKPGSFVDTLSLALASLSRDRGQL